MTDGTSVFSISYVGGDGNDVVLTTLLDYDQWEASAFGTGPTALSYQSPTGDPDEDEWPNGLEYLLGIDPMSHDDDPLAITVTGNEAQVRYPRVTTVPDGIDIVEWSTDLTQWFPLSVTPTTETLDASRDEVTWTVSVPTDVRVFYRIRTTFPEP